MSDNVMQLGNTPEPRPTKRQLYLKFLEAILEHSESDTARVAAGKILLDEDKKTAPAVTSKQTITFKPIGDEAEAESA